MTVFLTMKKGTGNLTDFKKNYYSLQDLNEKTCSNFSRMKAIKIPQ